MPIAPDDPRVRLVRTAFVTYYHVDLDKAAKFLLDFGFEIAERRGAEAIFFQGYGPDPYCYVARRAVDGEGPRFGGAAYLVESEAELEMARSNIPGASPVVTKLDGPGGGVCLTLTDPVGHQVHLVHGIQEKPAESADRKGLQRIVVNWEDEKPRVGKFQRFTMGPAPIHKWGHYGVSYPPGRYQDMVDFYAGHLALAFSDKVTLGGREAISFFHIDRGLEYTDHHSFYIKPAKTPDVAHSAFEIHDYDVQQLSHNYLESKGYRLSWGVGRHVLGSQIFDYWYDESGFELEHYCDGDLVNCETPVTVQENSDHTMYVWGPKRPTGR
jgi:hypothetical protein